MPITPLPTAPSRYDPANFTVRAEAFFAALATMVSEINGQAATSVVGNLGVSGVVQTTGMDMTGTALAIAGATVASGQTRSVNIFNNPANAGTTNFTVGNTNLGNPSNITFDGAFKVTGYGLTRVIETGYASEGLKIRSTQSGGFWAKVMFADSTVNRGMVGMADDGSGKLLLRTIGADPVCLGTNSNNAVQLDTSDNLLMIRPGCMGYGAGSGGAVVQATSKSTPVTLSKPSGQITMNAASLAAGARVQFTVTNTLVSAKDTVSLSITATSASYGYLLAVYVSDGSFAIDVKNDTASALAQAIVINFTINKGANA